jgi:hypothetical protein
VFLITWDIKPCIASIVVFELKLDKEQHLHTRDYFSAEIKHPSERLLYRFTLVNQRKYKLCLMPDDFTRQRRGCCYSMDQMNILTHLSLLAFDNLPSSFFSTSPLGK